MATSAGGCRISTAALRRRFVLHLQLRLLIPLLAPATALAETDTIELDNGDKVTGSVVERSDEVIVLLHALFGRIEVPVWKWNLTEDPVLSLRAGLENEYQSDVAPGRKRNDLEYYTSIGLDF